MVTVINNGIVVIVGGYDPVVGLLVQVFVGAVRVEGHPAVGRVLAPGAPLRREIVPQVEGTVHDLDVSVSAVGKGRVLGGNAAGTPLERSESVSAKFVPGASISLEVELLFRPEVFGAGTPEGEPG